MLVERVRRAAADRTPLCIRGGGTKDFYGNAPRGDVLDTRGLRGVVAHEPSELVVTVRAGTPLAELETLLAAGGQMLAFEPPHFGDDATVGGCVAAGLSGPRRASSGTTCGAVRDFLLGARLVDGRGQLLSFGGTVMKNVAGYDVTRVLAGSLGILGVIVEVSLKVLPRPVAETTLRFELDEANALAKLNEWGGQPLPISASAWSAGQLFLRLSGAAAALLSARESLGGEELDGAAFWQEIREQRHAFFGGDAPLWRLSVAFRGGPARFRRAGDDRVGWRPALAALEPAGGGDQVEGRGAGRPRHAVSWRRPVAGRVHAAAARARGDPRAAQG